MPKIYLVRAKKSMSAVSKRKQPFHRKEKQNPNKTQANNLIGTVTKALDVDNTNRPDTAGNEFATNGSGILNLKNNNGKGNFSKNIRKNNKETLVRMKF